MSFSLVIHIDPDFKDYQDHKTYYTYSFKSLKRTVISLFGLQTASNHPDVFLKIYPDNKIVSLFFLVYSFWTIYLITNIVVSIVYVNYKKYYANLMNSLSNFHDYSKIMAAAYNKDKQVVVLRDVAEMTRQYLAKGSDKLNNIIARHLQSEHQKKVLDPLPDPSLPRDTGCK